MKLKKILALALSGILAVSMLAGCGSKENISLNKNVTSTTGTVVGLVNEKTQKLTVKFASDGEFASQLAVVANNATLDDVKDLRYNAYLSSSAQGALSYFAKADWMQQAPEKAGTYVCGIWFDGGVSADEVAATVAGSLDLASGITTKFNVTKAALESYKLTLGTGTSEKTVWLVGILVTLEDKTSTT